MIDAYETRERKDGQIYQVYGRKIKRHERGYSETYIAWVTGVDDKERCRPNRNRYPAGLRHDEYERGYAQDRGF